MTQLEYAFAHRGEAALEVQRELAERKLRNYIKLLWPVLEPGRKFISGRVIDAICEHLEAVTAGQIRRLLINVPPGCSKSLITDVFWPSWEWGPKNLAELRYICVSYAHDLTLRDNRRCRSLIGSDIYQTLWGDRFHLSGDQNAKEKFENNRKGWKYATSIGGTMTGERGDRAIIDDPHNVKGGESEAKLDETAQVFTEVLPSRVNDPDKSAMIMIMQRIHERDVSSIAKELGWDFLCLPMRYESDHPDAGRVTSIGFRDWRKTDGELLWPERFSERYLSEDLEPTLAKWGGSYAVAGQLQQRPAPRGGGLFQKKDFIYVDSAPGDGLAVRGWDLAGSKKKGSAFTCGVKIRITEEGRLFIEDVVRFQGTPGDVEAAILECAERDGEEIEISIPQDPGQAGLAQVEAFARLLHGRVVHFSPESGAKEDRAKPLASQAEGGNVSLVRAPWNDAFVSEAAVFPKGLKDQIDAASRAYMRLLQRTRRFERPIPSAPELIKRF